MSKMKLDQGKPLSIFFSIFMPFFICILISLLLLSTILYSSFENIALKQVYTFQNNDLQSISSNLSHMINSAKALSVDAFFDSDISNLLYYENLEPNDYKRAQLRMTSYRNSNPFLYSICVYNGSQFYIEPSMKSIYIKDSIPDKDILKIINDMQKYPSQSLIPRKLSDDIKNNITPKYVYSYIFYDSPLSTGKIDEAIILNIREDWFRSTIDSFKKNNIGKILIIDGQGRLIINDITYPMLSDLSTNIYIKNILSSAKSTDFFRIDVDGTDSLVSFVKTGISDYTFISVTPYTKIIGEIQTMKKITYSIVFVISLIVTLIILILSRRLYDPIKSIVQKVNSLESDSKNSFFNRKQEYLKTLINNSYSYNLEDMEKNFKYYNIKLKYTENFLLLILKIDRFSSFCDIYNLEDRNLMKFGIMNISSELCLQYSENECIDIDDDHIALLLNFNKSDLPENTMEFLQVLQSIQDNIQKYLNISISITISNSFHNIKQLNSFYTSTLSASLNRLISGHKCIIFANHITQPPFNEIKYPTAREKQIFEFLKLGHIKDAKEVLSDIFINASYLGFAALNMTILRFMVSLSNTIETLKSTDNIMYDYSFSSIPNKLNKLETLSEIEDMFFEIFDKVFIQQEQNTQIKHQKLLDSAIEIINKEYFRQDLSLDTISEKLSISASYLSRLFKKYKMLSIVDYINMIRIEKAKELLTTTNDSINDIMDKTGFTSRSHFYTLFKKTYGMAPGNLKSNNNTDDSDIVN